MKIILSLFNGMNCIGLAMSQQKQPFRVYASEIDKYANKVSDALFPDTVNLGDVRLLRKVLCWSMSTLAKALASKWVRDCTKKKIKALLFVRDVEFDLIVAGSPCQGFSFAGKMLNFKDPRSKLFFDFVDILRVLQKKNPNIPFLLENVSMKKEYQEVISDLLGVEPLKINSALVSAQNRVRLYWTNIKAWKGNLFGNLVPGIRQPIDRKIYLRDILELRVREEYCVKIDKNGRIKKNQDKASCLTGGGNSGGNHSDMDLVVLLEEFKEGSINGIVQLNPNKDSNGVQPYRQDRVYSPDGKSPALDGNASRTNILLVPEANKKGFVVIEDGQAFDGKFLSSKSRRGRKMIDKSNALVASGSEFYLFKDFKIRRFTPTECCRLQTIFSWAIQVMLSCGVSNTQIYKMLGNGWTVEVVVYILSHLDWWE